MIREKGILMSAPMVLALKAKRKTQTRRLVVPLWVKPYAEVGDRLWVRETFCVHDASEGDLEFRADRAIVRYLDESPKAQAFWRGKSRDSNWRPSIFMPRFAARWLLEILSVRIERLHDITDEDAIAEGITRVYGRDVPAAMGGNVECWGWPGSDQWHTSPRAAYFEGWKMINGARSLAVNPEVWRVEFREDNRG